LTHLWVHLGWPLTRLLLFLAVGLLVALVIESLNWTKKLAVIARPLTRFGHLSPLTGASFSMCFFSGIAANTMLAEGYDTKKLSRKELILANLFNSLPNNFLHLPTTFFIAVPIIKGRSLYLPRPDRRCRPAPHPGDHAAGTAAPARPQERGDGADRPAPGPAPRLPIRSEKRHEAFPTADSQDNQLYRTDLHTLLFSQ
jgi:hypothetical protein